MPWFPKKQHDPLIAGMRLTRDRASFLLGLCRDLEKSLHEQSAYIEVFCVQKKGINTISTLNSIQERYSCITLQLASLILQVTTSTEPWLKELSDAQAGMQRKIIVCNDESTFDKMGRDKAARKYWPLIQETYTALSNLIRSLEQELSDAVTDDAIWTEQAKKLVRNSSVKSTKTRTPKSSFDGKGVRFKGTVEGRVFWREDVPSFEKERVERGREKTLRKSDLFEARLADDRKYTSGKLHERVLERIRGEESGKREDRPYEDEIVESR